MADEWKAPEDKGEDKSWRLLEKAVLAGVQEQRRARRWGIFFKLLTFATCLAPWCCLRPGRVSEALLGG